MGKPDVFNVRRPSSAIRSSTRAVLRRRACPQVVAFGVVDPEAGEHRRERSRRGRARVQVRRGCDLQVVLQPRGKRQEGEKRRVRLGEAGHEHDVVVALAEVTDDAVAAMSVGRCRRGRLTDDAEAVGVIDVQERVVLTADAGVGRQVGHVAGHAVHAVDAKEPLLAGRQRTQDLLEMVVVVRPDAVKSRPGAPRDGRPFVDRLVSLGVDEYRTLTGEDGDHRGVNDRDRREHERVGCSEQVGELLFDLDVEARIAEQP